MISQVTALGCARCIQTNGWLPSDQLPLRDVPVLVDKTVGSTNWVGFVHGTCVQTWRQMKMARKMMPCSLTVI